MSGSRSLLSTAFINGSSKIFDSLGQNDFRPDHPLTIENPLILFLFLYSIYAKRFTKILLFESDVNL